MGVAARPRPKAGKASKTQSRVKAPTKPAKGTKRPPSRAQPAKAARKSVRPPARKAVSAKKPVKPAPVKKSLPAKPLLKSEQPKAPAPPIKPKGATPKPMDLEPLSGTHNQLAAAIGKLLQTRLRQAHPGKAHGMPGWKYPRLRKVSPGMGQMNRNEGFVTWTHSEDGFTIHIWNPVEYFFVETHRKLLEDAGFVVGRAFFTWSKADPMPANPLDALFGHLRASLERDAA